MRILHIKLVNFNSIKAAMGLTCLELDFASLDKPIIQIYARNRCGKSVLLSNLNPFSSINYDGDERNELPSIIKGETGLKNIVYEINGKVYNITHTYKPTTKSHSILSSILEDGVELNPSGGVNTFNILIEKIFGLNKYIFQFIINSTQLTSFAKCSPTQRKNRLNKSLGIDIYDKMHKLATDDYRYTNKMIQSLNSTKEFLVGAYGTYESLITQLSETRIQYKNITDEMESLKSNMNKLNGMITSLRSQNIEAELFDINRQISDYESITSSIGEYNGLEYDKIVSTQMSLNTEINDLKTKRLLMLKDIDMLYSKRDEIQKTINNNQRNKNDYDNMVSLISSLKDKINSISISIHTEASSERYRALVSHGQTINSICKEVIITLNKNHLHIFSEMIKNGIDISVYLTKESTTIMDAEKEKVITSKIHQLLQSADGRYPEEGLCTDRCVYKYAYELMEAYFNSLESDDPSKLTSYDISNMDNAYKNIQTIQRLLSIEVPNELKQMFNIVSVMDNLENGKYGIDIDYITTLMEESSKAELRIQLMKQLSDAESSLNNMQIDNVDYSSDISSINERIDSIQNECNQLNDIINDKQTQVNDIDTKRIKLSSIQNINIKDLRKNQSKLTRLMDEMNSHISLYSEYELRYNTLYSQSEYVKNSLTRLEQDNDQFTSTEHAIAEHITNNNLFKVISDATSSTKGLPVEEIRNKVDSALSLTNRLLKVMYDSELEMLRPTINETEFLLPFRVGVNVNSDIRYGSQSEQALLSLAVSMSLASFLTEYNNFLIDEIDAYLDSVVAEDFVNMLSEIMSICKIEQIFLISHHITTDRCPQYVYELNLLNEIERQKSDEE